MEIRKMTIEDYDTVFRLWSRADDMGTRSLDDSREGIAKFLRRNPDTSFVATINGEIIGVMMSGHDGRRGYIYHYAVQTAHRGPKIGNALQEAVIRAMQEEGINKIGLLVHQTNESGIAYWESNGWRTRTTLCYLDKTLNVKNV